MALLYGGTPGDYQGQSQLTKRVWLEAWPEAEARKALMQPPPLWTPDGVYSLVLRATGDEEAARMARLQSVLETKMRSIQAGR